MSDEEFASSQDRIDEIIGRADKAVKSLDNRTAVRLLLEAQRLAKDSENAASCMYLLFRLTNSRDMMEPERLREWAVELIALLESDDRVRAIQADYEEWNIEWLRSRLTSCAYDNLATHIASMQGYNSTGMHDCIAEGIQVCRRTNKLECVTCFREYATDVYTASDDLDMARHYAQLCIDQVHRDESDDRRYVGYSDLAGIQLLNGQLDEAIETLQACLEVVPHYHSPLDARMETHHEFARVLLIGGRFDQFEAIVGEPRLSYEGSADDNRRHHFQRVLTETLIETCAGNYSAAIEQLVALDQDLTRRRCLSDWFVTRLRLIAANLLAGNQAAADRLAAALEAKATDAQDWLTLRRLKRLMDPQEITDPLALLQAPQYGPWSDSRRTPTLGAAPGDQMKTAAETPGSSESPADSAGTPQGNGEAMSADDGRVAEDIKAVQNALISGWQSESDEAADNSALWDQILKIPLPGRIDRLLIAQLLHLTRFMAINDDRANAIWTWVQSLTRMWQDDANVTGLAGLLYDRLNEFDAPRENGLSKELVERMMTRAASLGTDNGTILKIVGGWYQAEGHDGKAEQALARAFRLDRSDAEAALALAQMYQQQERPRDALAALDLCLRSGGRDSDVLWEAGLAAWSLEKYEPAITYFSTLIKEEPDRPWARYYIAIAALELNRPDAAQEAITAERNIVGDQDYHLNVLEAAVAFLRDDMDATMNRTNALLQTPVAGVDYLAPGGFERIYRILWESAADRLREHDPEFLHRLALHMTGVGFGPDPFFIWKRECSDSAVSDDVQVYTCTVRQPLGDNWKESLYCRQDEDTWTAYECRWGVLAESESDAEQHVRRMHAELHDQPVEMIATEETDDGYSEVPGIVWQGYRVEAERKSDH